MFSNYSNYKLLYRREVLSGDRVLQGESVR